MSNSTHSRPVTSNQTGPHENLVKNLHRHLAAPFQKPVQDHNQRAFDQVATQIAKHGAPIILDSCCGTGESSRHIARQHPAHVVVAIDKSASRLNRENDEDVPENLLMIRADLVDFWRLACDAGWTPDRHYILYPNPWPKSEHLRRRWHGMPVFRQIAMLGGRLELRSNWKVYLEEFSIALREIQIQGDLTEFCPDQPITAFERKYNDSGQQLWRLTADLSTATLPPVSMSSRT